MGGINLNPQAVVSAGHPGGGGIHDAYVEIEGPSATDVHHNFVQRWNGASERGLRNGSWGPYADKELQFPRHTTTPCGSASVQIQRNLHAGLYGTTHPAPDAPNFPVADGEYSIRQQYLDAITGAQQSIYIENQALSVSLIVDALRAAVRRGVDVIVLLPAEPEGWFITARADLKNRAFFEVLSSLGRFDNFSLCGIASLDLSGRRRPIYVHAKLMIVDGVWATIGSCNLHRNSLFGHSELNAAIWCSDFARRLRCELFAEHLGVDTASIDECAAHSRFRDIARENARRSEFGIHDWQGLAFALDPSRYGD
ncbi:MAG: phospholipase D-like domain-containing protein [Hyphomicrobium sp.]